MAQTVNRFANLGAHLGLRAGPAERAASMSLADYCYPSVPPNPEVLRQQAALLGAPRYASLPNGAAPLPTAPTAGSMQPAPFTQLPLSASVLPNAGAAAHAAGHHHNASSCFDLLDNMLPLDLDDDCLRLMLGEEEEESTKEEASSAQQGSEVWSMKPVGHDQQQLKEEEEDAVDLLFQDLSSLRHVASYGSLDLDVLSSLQDFETPNSGEDAGQKRARKEGGPTLMLQMNYTSAAETINLLIDADFRKANGGCIADPGSPASHASDGTCEDLGQSNNSAKRKRV